MAKKENSGCVTILAIVLLLGILAALARVIGVIMIIAAIGGAIYFFKNKAGCFSFSAHTRKSICDQCHRRGYHKGPPG